MAEGYTTLVVPKESPGVSLEDNWDTMGMRATISWSLVLDDVFVPWENVLGQPGDWIQHDPRTFTLAYCANHLGTAQGVFDFVLDYLKQRPFLMNDDTVAFTVGEMDSAIQATRTSLWYAAWLWEEGRFDEAELASMRALHTSKQMALMVTSKAFDVCGARAAFRSPADRARLPGCAHLLAPFPRIAGAADGRRGRSRRRIPLQAEIRRQDRPPVVGGAGHRRSVRRS